MPFEYFQAIGYIADLTALGFVVALVLIRICYTFDMPSVDSARMRLRYLHSQVNFALPQKTTDLATL